MLTCNLVTGRGLITETDFLNQIPRGFLLVYKVSIEHMQRVRHANRGRLLLRTPGSVPIRDLHVF